MGLGFAGPESAGPESTGPELVGSNLEIMLESHYSFSNNSCWIQSIHSRCFGALTLNPVVTSSNAALWWDSQLAFGYLDQSFG